MNDLPQGSENGKLRYVIFGRGRMAEVFLIRDGAPKQSWRFIHLFHSLADARAAVARYLDARAVAKSMGARLD